MFKLFSCNRFVSAVNYFKAGTLLPVNVKMCFALDEVINCVSFL